MTIEGVLPVHATGELLDTTIVTQSNGETQAHREAVFVADPEDNDARAKVTNSIPGTTDYGGVVRVVPWDFEIATAAGLITGCSSFDKWGRNAEIDTGTTPEDVWGGGGLYTGFPTGAAETIDISSGNAADTAAGTGLRTCRLYGQLNGVDQTEDVTLLGATLVTTTKTWTRMNRIRGLTAGSGGVNAGELTAHHTTTANVFAVVPVGTNRTHIAAWTVPAGKTAYIKQIDWRIVRSSGAAGSATLAVMCRGNGGVWEQTLITDLTTGGSFPLLLNHATTFAALTDIVIRVLDVSDSNTSVTALINGKYVDD